jgi:YggT family protein
MTAVSVLATIVYVALFLFFILMWARFILDLLTNFVRGFKPRGLLLVVAEVAYTVTDPPLRAVRKVLPPVRFGGVALDFGWSLVMLAVIILMAVVSAGIGL